MKTKDQKIISLVVGNNQSLSHLPNLPVSFEHSVIEKWVSKDYFICWQIFARNQSILSKCAFKCPVNRIALTEIVIWSGTFPIEDQPQNNSGKVFWNMYSLILSWGAAYLQCKSVAIFNTFFKFSPSFNNFWSLHGDSLNKDGDPLAIHLPTDPFPRGLKCNICQ